MQPNVLRRFPSLRGATPELLDRLAQAVVYEHYRPGEVVFQEGAAGGTAYLNVEGTVEVIRGEGSQEIALARRGPGDLFGEMGLVEGSPRFATIRALEQTHLLQLSEQAMRSLCVEQPEFLYQTVEMLSARLREADLLLIADLQRKNQELARAYRALQEAQARLVDQERLERELELAREIQQSMLPSKFPRIPGVEFAACSRPARHVGGNFYDVISLGAGHRVGLVIGDVSDKGMPAALFMALGHTESVTLEKACADFLPGDTLVLYTDGITDAPRPSGEFFGVQRLRETVCGAGDVTAHELCDRILSRVQAFQAGSAQYDDMALLVLKKVA